MSRRTRKRLPAAASAPTMSAEPKPELMGVRHLGLDHIGRFIELPGRPRLHEKHEPSVLTTVARLVGIRPPEKPYAATPPSRVLVLQQGPGIRAIELPVDEPVRVAPREWS